jgi:hypothetical protein
LDGAARCAKVLRMDTRLTLEALEAMVAEARRQAEGPQGRPLRAGRPTPRRARPATGSRRAGWR